MTIEVEARNSAEIYRILRLATRVGGRTSLGLNRT